MDNLSSFLTLSVTSDDMTQGFKLQTSFEQQLIHMYYNASVYLHSSIYCKQREVIALEQLTSHMPLSAGPQQQRLR